jgi:AcrR family transcriptional regulator
VPERASTKQARRTRAYASPRRQKQAADTKAAVVDAARALFSERGWAGTGMREVATAAEVSVETVYSLFGSKPGLFQAALDAAIVGDHDDPVPVADGPEFKALGGASELEAIRIGAHMMARSHRDSAGLQRALREAGASDPNLAPVLAENEERRRADTAKGLQLVLGRRPTPTERDGCWALTSFEIFDLLVGRSGWSLRRYENWLADRLSSLDWRTTQRQED